MNTLKPASAMQRFSIVLQRDFNLCFFLSLSILALYPDPEHFFSQFRNSPWFIYTIIPAFNGIYTTLLALFLNRTVSRRNYTRNFYSADIPALIAVSFSAGCLSTYITLSEAATYVISVVIIYLAYRNIKQFAALLTSLLRPDTTATIKDLGAFANFFINLMISFSVINLSLNAIHNHLNIEQAFNFGSGLRAIIDSIYFSIITMTTVGYGDIYPHTTLARLLTSAECLTSYLMLGIMIGIVSRGITVTPENRQ